MFILELTPDIRAMPDSGSTSVQSEMSPQSGYYSAEGKISGRIPPIKSNTVGVQTGKYDALFLPCNKLFYERFIMRP